MDRFLGFAQASHAFVESTLRKEVEPNKGSGAAMR
jgi:hypothetical protein